MKSINHIHVPRCSGVYLRSHIISDLKVRGIEYFATNSEDISEHTFKNKRFISGHLGLTPLKYRDDLINIALVRNPVDRFISNFLYINKGLRQLQLNNELEKWIEDSTQLNIQAKSFASTINEEKYNLAHGKNERALNGWFLEDINVSIDDIKTFIDTIEVIETIENHDIFIKKTNKLLLDVFGFESISNNLKINSNFNTMVVSKNLIKKIEELNELDMEVYEYVSGKG